MSSTSSKGSGLSLERLVDSRPLQALSIALLALSAAVALWAPDIRAPGVLLFTLLLWVWAAALAWRHFGALQMRLGEAVGHALGHPGVQAAFLGALLIYLLYFLLVIVPSGEMWLPTGRGWKVATYASNLLVFSLIALAHALLLLGVMFVLSKRWGSGARAGR